MLLRVTAQLPLHNLTDIIRIVNRCIMMAFLDAVATRAIQEENQILVKNMFLCNRYLGRCFLPVFPEEQGRPVLPVAAF
jgi:hypothetical protein